MSSGRVFVGRQRELAQLEESLTLTLGGQGQVRLLAGEAGAGKSALLQEFTHRAQQGHKDLIAAAGVCNYLDGKGDPYLPFREVLAMLTGDAETGVAQGRVSQDSASRLASIVARSGQILVDIAPDLINVVIPGSRVVAMVGKAIASRAGWLQKLDGLAKREKPASGQGEPAMQPEKIYQEYADFLVRLSESNPILISIDDLQWMDNASIGLFFHLVRKIENHRIMLLGAYRPDGVSQVRDGGRHPLGPILSEIARYYGDATIDLSSAERSDGESFVDELLDTEPNLLNDAFRQALCDRTEGHPLFTVELIRTLKEAGDIRLDESGRWTAVPEIDWSALPKRVEGVVAERIARIEEADRKLLEVASVEGGSFTAEVIGRVLEMEPRQVVGRLGSELTREQGLVIGAGVRRVGSQRLSAYTFKHRLFQEYVYGLMDEAERTYMHEDVARALLDLYGDEDGEIIGQLAYHYHRAGVADQAFKYAVMAGDRAYAVFAAADAAEYYTSAVGLLDSVAVSAEDVLHLFLNFGRALELSGQVHRALECYEQLEDIATLRNDRKILLASLTARSVLLSIPTSAHDPEESRRLATRALGLAREISDEAAEARILWCLLLIDVFGGHLEQAIASGEESLELCRRIELKEQLAFTLHDLVLPYWTLGQKDKARAALDEVGALWLELGNQPMLANSLGRRAQLAHFAGAFDQARDLAEESLQISRRIGNLSGISLGQTLLGLLSLEQGALGRAIDSLREALDRGIESDNLLASTGVRAELGWALSCVGAFEEGLELAEQAVIQAERHIGNFVDWCRAIRARIRLRMVLPAEAKEPDFQVGDAEQTESFFMGGPAVAAATVESALALGDLDAALARSDRHLQYLDHMGARSQRPYALFLRSRVLLGRGSNDQARESLDEARRLAETMGARYTLWMILDGLARFAEAQGGARTNSPLRSQARSILADIAAGIDNQAYRAAFLGLPDVGRILGREYSGDPPPP